MLPLRRSSGKEKSRASLLRSLGPVSHNDSIDALSQKKKHLGLRDLPPSQHDSIASPLDTMSRHTTVALLVLVRGEGGGGARGRGEGRWSMNEG